MPVPYQGDYQPGAVVTVWHNSFTSDDPSASVTMTNYTDTDVHIYKDDSLTQRQNTAGMTLDIDVDTYVGVHKITIDTADNTVADFWEAGHDYAVVIEGTTIDGATVNAAVATFSIANRRVAGQMCSSSIEALTDQSNFTLTTGEASGDNDAYNGCTIIVTDQTTKIQKAVGHISDYVGATRAIVLHAAPLQTAFTMAVGDSVEIFATSAFANVNTVGQTLQTANDNGADINEILTDTSTTIPGTITTAQNDLDTITGTAGVLIATDAQDLSGSLDVNTKTITAGAIANASFNADVGSTAHGTNIIALACRKILEELNLDHLLKVDTTVAADGDLEDYVVGGTVLAHLLAASADATDFKASTDSLEAIKVYADTIKAETAVLNAFWNVFILVAGTIGAVGNDTTHLHLTGLTYGDDELNDYIIVTYDASESEYHSSWILDWDNASALATVATLAFTPQDSTDQYWVFSSRKHPDIANIVADTNELQTDWVNGGRLDLILDAILAMLDDARTEPGDTAPPVNPDAMTKIDYLYKFLRNKIETTATKVHIYDDAGTNKDQTSTISDDGTTFTRGEFGAGE